MAIKWQSYWQTLDLNRFTRAPCLRSQDQKYLIAYMERIDGLQFVGRAIYYAIYWNGCIHKVLSIHRQEAAAQRSCERHSAAL